MDTWFWVVILLGAALIALVIVGAVRARSRVDPTDISLDPALVAKIRDHYRKGDKLGAVKALRAATGLGLADAVRIVDKLGATAKPASKAGPSTAGSSTAGSSTAGSSTAGSSAAGPVAAGPVTAGGVPPISATIGPDHEDELRSLVAAGQQIEAIKMVRTLTGMGLKDAKEYVDRLPPG